MPFWLHCTHECLKKEVLQLQLLAAKAQFQWGGGSTIFSNNCSRQLAVEVTRVSSKHVPPGQQGSTSGTSTGTSGPAEGL